MRSGTRNDSGELSNFRVLYFFPQRGCVPTRHTPRALPRTPPPHPPRPTAHAAARATLSRSRSPPLVSTVVVAAPAPAAPRPLARAALARVVVGEGPQRDSRLALGARRQRVRRLEGGDAEEARVRVLLSHRLTGEEGGGGGGEGARREGGAAGRRRGGAARLVGSAFPWVCHSSWAGASSARLYMLVCSRSGPTRQSHRVEREAHRGRRDLRRAVLEEAVLLQRERTGTTTGAPSCCRPSAQGEAAAAARERRGAGGGRRAGRRGRGGRRGGGGGGGGAAAAAPLAVAALRRRERKPCTSRPAAELIRLRTRLSI